LAQFDSGKITAIFQDQFTNNPIYRSYIETLGSDSNAIKRVEQIPFLPISFFKTHKVQTGEFEPVMVFESSGTTGETTSRHYIKDLALYEASFMEGFRHFYGSLTDYCILALLPSYLGRPGSSLVYMVSRLIKESGDPDSGFYLDQYEKLGEVLHRLESAGRQTLLIGVSFALVDFAESFGFPLSHTIIMETGGMKGRRKEITREELHGLLKEKFSLTQVHSEYGMTELLSQAYSKKEGIFQCSPSMEVLIRSEDDPFAVYSASSIRHPVSGIINVVDLANIHSCSFIATDDAGRLYPDGSFEVLGRIDNSDIRGCALLSID
jgi:hypothetical protein